MSRKRTKQKKASVVCKHYELRSSSKKDADVKLAATSKKKRASRRETKAPNDLHCTICLDTHRYKAMTRFLCGHSFHKRCIDSWIKVSQSCPICRKPVKEQSASRGFHAAVTGQPEPLQSTENQQQVFDGLAALATLVLAAVIHTYVQT